MGTGYVFNEEILFAESRFDREHLTHTEKLTTVEETAFLRVDIATFDKMSDLDRSSSHLMED